MNDFQCHLDLIMKVPNATPRVIESQLLALAFQWKSQGMTQLAAFEVFHSYYTSLLGVEAEEITDAYEFVLDRIWGWCAPDAKIFDGTMTNEEWREYQESKGTSYEA